MDDHLRDLDEFLRDFAGKSELTSALSTVRTAGEGDVHVHEAASGRDDGGEIPGGGLAGAASGGAPSSALDAPIGRVGPAGAHPSAAATSSAPRVRPGVVVVASAAADGEDGDEDGSPAHAAALERDRAAAARLGSGVGAPGHARSSPGRRGSFPSNNDPVDGPESPSQLSNHAPSGHLVNQQSPSDVSSSAPMSTSPGNGTNSLGLSRRNTHGGSSFTLAAEDNPTPQSVPPPTFGDQGNIGEKHVLVMVGFLSFPNVGLLGNRHGVAVVHLSPYIFLFVHFEITRTEFAVHS